ncbi:hypothetical protein MPH_01508 [Macrophomina phaseolina MS6]|uniref:Uncharacterized protein n=1 Tax=Macrophomina phaseolina (strain MS6) TaxID=1126212 RepID=K2S8B9_MACPH|nr:hypothetical protein MPH_01508 [Macrophomina phaseolina MS6]
MQGLEWKMLRGFAMIVTFWICLALLFFFFFAPVPESDCFPGIRPRTAWKQTKRTFHESSAHFTSDGVQRTVVVHLLVNDVHKSLESLCRRRDAVGGSCEGCLHADFCTPAEGMLRSGPFLSWTEM